VMAHHMQQQLEPHANWRSRYFDSVAPAVFSRNSKL